MDVPFSHIRHQGTVLASLGEALLSGLWSSVVRADRPLPKAPGPEVRATIPELAEDLVRDFVKNAGGDPSSWRGVVPPHLFPHWSFPLVVRTLRDLPYPFWRALNAGSRMIVNAPLPLGKPLEGTARLERIEQDERRVVLETRVTTGTRESPQALVADFFAFIPLGSGGTKKEAETVPDEASELERWKLSANAGLEFALLTGDFNLIHWLPLYARAAGFPNVILHGFGTMARAVEGVVRARLGGDGSKLAGVDVRFTKPLVLPAEVGLYVLDERIFVGDAPGRSVYLVGAYSARKDDSRD
jgi:MaoC dehydratase-like protein